MELQHRIGGDQLGIALNPEADGELLTRDGANAPEITFGDTTFTLLGPAQAEIDSLRKEWQKWLDDTKNEKTLTDIEEARKKDADAFTNAAEAFIRPIERQGRELAATLLTPAIAAKAEDLGRRGSVTPPNLASLMFLVEEGTTKKKRLLLTGDGHADDIIDGLAAHGKLSAKKKLHVDVLKVLQHGAEYNMTPEFARDITADHYVFCGNGYATNPEVIVLETIVEQRANGRKGNYKFWFNCDPDTASYRKHMQLVRETVERLEAESGGRMSYEFISGAFEVPV